MPPRTRKPVAVKPPNKNSLVIETRMVPVSELKMYHKNPRIGNVELIAKSLHINGQYKPIVVNIGTLTGRPMEILAGNHTYLGSRKEVHWTSTVRRNGKVVTMKHDKLPWHEIEASIIDVDEEKAAQIVLVDNKASDESEYDWAILDQMLSGMDGNFEGTGFTELDYEDLHNTLNKSIGQQAQSFQDNTPPLDVDAMMGREKKSKIQEAMEKRQSHPEAVEADAHRGAAPTSIQEDTELDEVKVKEAELQIRLELKQDISFRHENYWGIPVLRSDMILQSFPEPLATWGGKDASTDDGKTNWLWMAGVSSMTGLPRNERTLVNFMTYDTKFENWWAMPAYYTAKVISFGVKTIFTPDFSTWADQARALHLFNNYRAAWLARFFQEAGLAVVPVALFVDPESVKHAMYAIPKGSPTLAISAQTSTREELKEFQRAESVKRLVGELETKELMVYAGPPGHDAIREMDLESQGVKVLYVENYAAVRRHNVFDKREGAANLTPAQKKKLKEKIMNENKDEPPVEPDDD